MEVIAIFDCDEWKSKSSMRLIMISSIKKLNENLEMIKREKNYTDEDMETYIFISHHVIDEQ